MISDITRYTWDDERQVKIKRLTPRERLQLELKATQAQLEAGNYKKKHIKFQGFDISLENEAGSTRDGVGKDGKPWSRKMHYDYGYIRRTMGVDGDHVDVYLGPAEDADYVYVVHQCKPDSGKYDEDKCMLGFDSAEDAKAAYLKQYDDPKFFGALTVVPLELFRHRVFNDKGEQIVPDSHKRAEMKGFFKEDDHPRGEDGKWVAGGEETRYKELDKAQRKQMKKLSPAQNKAVMRYISVSGEYRDINGYLRGAPKELNMDTARVVLTLDSAFDDAGHMLAQNATVYRGVRGTSAEFRGLSKGDVFKDRGYVSTSQRRAVAEGFSGRTFVEIRLPKGQKFLIGSLGEDEIILPRDLQYKVVSRSKNTVGVGEFGHQVTKFVLEVVNDKRT